MADSSTAIATATATATTTAASKLPESKRWADVAEEADEQEAAAESSSTEEVKLDSLTIDESKPAPSELTDPDDSRIEAVTADDTPYTSAKRFEDLNLSPELVKGLYVEMKFEKPSKIQAITRLYVEMVFSENWVVYHYFNLRAHRYEMSVIEICDQARADEKDVLKLVLGTHNLTSPITSYSRSEVFTKSQSYFFSHSVKTIAVTSTAKGITSKQISSWHNW